MSVWVEKGQDVGIVPRRWAVGMSRLCMHDIGVRFRIRSRRCCR